MDGLIEIAKADGMLLLRVLVALALSAPIGWEREHKDRAAGLRTHMLVAAAAALFVSLGPPLATQEVATAGRMAYDPTRLLHAVAVGIGFLGAGVIFVSKEGDRVKGLTTAASIWVTAAIGATVALERWVLAAGGTALVLIVLHVLHEVERRVLDSDDRAHDEEGEASAAE